MTRARRDAASITVPLFYSICEMELGEVAALQADDGVCYILDRRGVAQALPGGVAADRPRPGEKIPAVVDRYFTAVYQAYEDRVGEPGLTIEDVLADDDPEHHEGLYV